MRIVKITAKFQSYQLSGGVSSIMKQLSFPAFNLPHQIFPRIKNGKFMGGDMTVLPDKTFQ
jgi:hypothetical protein